jgi:uncharacterized membrane protein YphA (DoxX/SURF4 family)
MQTKETIGPAGWNDAPSQAAGMGWRRDRVLQWLTVAARLVLAVIFLWAGLAKAVDRQSSILAVDAYRVVPAALVRPVATALPWVEIAVGLFLVLGLFVRFAGISAGALLLVFISGMAQAKARGLRIDCGCFGGGGAGAGVTWWDLGRDALLLVTAGFLAWRPGGPLQLDTLITGPEPEPEDDDG